MLRILLFLVVPEHNRPIRWPESYPRSSVSASAKQPAKVPLPARQPISCLVYPDEWSRPINGPQFLAGSAAALPAVLAGSAPGVLSEQLLAVLLAELR